MPAGARVAAARTTASSRIGVGAPDASAALPAACDVSSSAAAASDRRAADAATTASRGGIATPQTHSTAGTARPSRLGSRANEPSAQGYDRDTTGPSPIPAGPGPVRPPLSRRTRAVSASSATLDGHVSHEIVERGIEVLTNLLHRGASGADANTGDGAGIMTQIPDRFFSESCESLGIMLPPAGDYGVGMMFLPLDAETQEICRATVERTLAAEGLSFLGWREVPTDETALGDSARASRPSVWQCFIARGEDWTAMPSNASSTSHAGSASGPWRRPSARGAVSTCPVSRPAPSSTRAS